MPERLGGRQTTCKDRSSRTELFQFNPALLDAFQFGFHLGALVRDLLVTERTLAKLADVDLPDEPAAPSQPNKSRKPADIPSVHQMAVIVIRERGEEWVDGAGNRISHQAPLVAYSDFKRYHPDPLATGSKGQPPA